MTIRYKEFLTGDILNITSSNGIYHACNVIIKDTKIKGTHPYVVRTSQNNGIRGYISADERTLNPGNTISFAQDTGVMFYQKEPYFTGNKVKIMSIKDHEMNENIALFLITCLNKAFSSFSWGQSYDLKILSKVRFSLPVQSHTVPNWSLLDKLLNNQEDSNLADIDTSSWLDFKITDIFSIIPSDCFLQKLDYVKECPEKSDIFNNFGNSKSISNSSKKEAFNNIIAIDKNGNIKHYSNSSCIKPSDNILCLLLLNSDINDKVREYLESVLLDNLPNTAAADDCVWKNILDIKLLLPSSFHDFPDWNYMERQILDLEQDRITELKKIHNLELSEYLIAAGIEDYELTSDDLKALSISESDLDSVMDQHKTSRSRIEMRRFQISNLFQLYKGHRLTKANRLPGVTPFIGSSEMNNGITGYIGQAPQFEGNAITVSYNGSVGQVFYQEKSFCASDDITVLYLNGQNLDKELFGYLGASLYCAGKKFSYDYKWNLKRMQITTLMLPIQTDSKGFPIIDENHLYHTDGFIPDWDYMRSYTLAMEKLIIKDNADFFEYYINKLEEYFDGYN